MVPALAGWPMQLRRRTWASVMLAAAPTGGSTVRHSRQSRRKRRCCARCTAAAGGGQCRKMLQVRVTMSRFYRLPERECLKMPRQSRLLSWSAPHDQK